MVSSRATPSLVARFRTALACVVEDEEDALEDLANNGVLPAGVGGTVISLRPRWLILDQTPFKPHTASRAAIREASLIGRRTDDTLQPCA